MKDLNVSSITSSIVSVKNWVVQHRIVLFIVIVSSVFGFMILRIAQMSTMEPTSQQKTEALQSIKIVKIDESAITVIKQLEYKNIAIDTLFDPGRYDPFSD
jgi:hypothetical protein